MAPSSWPHNEQAAERAAPDVGPEPPRRALQPQVVRHVVLARGSTAPLADPLTIGRAPRPEPPYRSSTRFISSPDELNQLIATSDAVMVMVAEEQELRRADGELWDRFAKETEGKVDCVRVSRATLDAARGMKSQVGVRYFAFNNHEWHYESANLSKRPFCDMLSCPVIAMPKSDRPTPPPTFNYNGMSLGTLHGPTPLAFEQAQQIKDCFLIASLMAVSHAAHDALTPILRENYDGSMTMTLPGADTPPTLMDSRLYIQRDGVTFLYSHARAGWKSATSWLPFVEKGFAALMPEGYGSLNRGGLAAGALSLLTGRVYGFLKIADTAPDRLLELARNASHVPMVASSFNPELHLNENHAFTVFGVETDIAGTQYVVLGDPRGSGTQEFRAEGYDADTALPGEQRSDHDGVFRVTIDDFRRLFEGLALPADMIRPTETRLCHPKELTEVPPYSADFKQYITCRAQ